MRRVSNGRRGTTGCVIDLSSGCKPSCVSGRSTVGTRSKGLTLPEIVPLPTQISGACLEYSPGTFDSLGHTGLVKLSLDYPFTGTLDRTTSDLQTSLTIGWVVHAVLIVGVIGDSLLDGLDLGLG